MITAQDYNTLLGSSTGGVVKIKSINRTFSGHSRYSKFSDPTGTYSNLYLTGKDATVSTQDKIISISTAANATPAGIFGKHVKHILDNDEFVNLYYMGFTAAFVKLRDDTIPNGGHAYTPNSLTWNNPSTSSAGVLTGFITDAVPSIQRVGDTATDYMKYVTSGAMIKFKHTDAASVVTYTWAKVVDVQAHGLGLEKITGGPSGKRADGTGAIILDAKVLDGSTIDIIYPALSRMFSARERTLLLHYIEANRTFSVKYNYRVRSWDIDTTPVPFSSTDAFPTFTSDDDSWLLYFNATGTTYDIHLRTKRINFSSNSVKLGNITNELELGTSYFQHGFLQTNELFGISPFKVKVDSSHVQLTEVNFQITPINDDEFLFSISENNLHPYNILSKKIDKSLIADLDIEEKHTFNSVIETEFYLSLIHI